MQQELEDLGKEKLRLVREADEKEARLDWTRKESETLEHRHQEALKRIHELEGDLSRHSTFSDGLIFALPIPHDYRIWWCQAAVGLGLRQAREKVLKSLGI